MHVLRWATCSAREPHFSLFWLALYPRGSDAEKQIFTSVTLNMSAQLQCSMLGAHISARERKTNFRNQASIISWRHCNTSVNFPDTAYSRKQGITGGLCKSLSFEVLLSCCPKGPALYLHTPRQVCVQNDTVALQVWNFWCNQVRSCFDIVVVLLHKGLRSCRPYPQFYTLFCTW